MKEYAEICACPHFEKLADDRRTDDLRRWRRAGPTCDTTQGLPFVLVYRFPSGMSKKGFFRHFLRIDMAEAR